MRKLCPWAAPQDLHGRPWSQGAGTPANSRAGPESPLLHPIYMVCRALEGTGFKLCPTLPQTSLHPELAGQQTLIPRVSRAGWP